MSRKRKVRTKSTTKKITRALRPLAKKFIKGIGQGMGPAPKGGIRYRGGIAGMR
jgi:hypothetical protein